MELNDDLFKKVEKKTHVNKEAILSIASRLNEGNMKDEKTLNGVITELSNLCGKEVNDTQKKKIIDLILSDKVPNNVDKLF